jgi:hypothetical protein
MVLGSKVIDHERISGVREQPFEVAVAYKVMGGVIHCTWSFPAAYAPQQEVPSNTMCPNPSRRQH